MLTRKLARTQPWGALSEGTELALKASTPDFDVVVLLVPEDPVGVEVNPSTPEPGVSPGGVLGSSFAGGGGGSTSTTTVFVSLLTGAPSPTGVPVSLAVLA